MSRNTIFVVALLVASHALADDGFKPIFNGTTLDGWSTKDMTSWTVEEGAITAKNSAENPIPGNQFLVWQGGDLDDFELKLRFRIEGPDGANSGVQFRSRVNPDGHVAGYQADMDRAGQWIGALHDELGRGTLAKRGLKVEIAADGARKETQAGDAAALFKNIDINGWNDYHITARGGHITLKINGQTTAEVHDAETAHRDLSGVLALQLHSGPPMTVRFKDIQLKRLPLSDGRKKVVFAAGNKSHAYGAHDHKAGCTLLADRLNASGLPVHAVVYYPGYPSDPTAFDNADSIVFYCDGGGGHPANAHLAEIDAKVAAGTGVACIHYGVETTAGTNGEAFLRWIGGYFEPNWSVNPFWEIKDIKLNEGHPITRGVKPFQLVDEFYYHMRFREGMSNVTPIVSAMPPASTLVKPDGTLAREDGPHSNNPHVRAAVLERKEPQHIAWASENEGGSRGFGFTGGHVHWNWANDDFRKLVINAIAWTAKVELPAEGIASKTPGVEEMMANHDEEANLSREQVTKLIKAARGPTSERDPEQATEGLDVHPELQASLFAAEPMLLSPTNIDVDHLGRVWACEVVNYRGRNGQRPEGDRILVFEDTDGDGKADKSTVFYQGRDIDSALGIGVLGNKVIVSCAPNVFVFTDEDGDLKADKKELLFTHVGIPQHDHSTHAFTFGPDGKLYWNVGNTGKQVHDKDGKPVIDKAGNAVNDSGNPYRQGMVFRCNLDGSEFEVLGHNFRNNYEVAVDSFGTLWQSDNDDDGNKGVRINYVMEFGNYGYTDEVTGAAWTEPRTNLEAEIPLRHWHLNDPGVVPNMLLTGAGSPTGILLYEGDLLPKVFHGQIIHCDAGPNIVRAYPAQKDGAGYKAEVVDILHGARDPWFRPSDVCVAPDGSLIVADWYDPGVGGHAMGDVERGRLFRITTSGQPKYVAPKYDFSTAEGAAEALKSPNLSARYLAWTALHGMGEKAEPALLKLWKSENPRYRARALWLLARLGLNSKVGGKPQNIAGNRYWLKGIKDNDANIRIMAVRMRRERNLIPALLPFNDASPQVRRECAISLRHDTDPVAAEVWAELAAQHDGKDRWYLEALGIGADKQWDPFLAAWLKKVGDQWNTPTGRDILWRSRAKVTPEYLVKILKDPATPKETHARYMRAFDFLSGPEKDKALESLLDL